MKIPCKDCITLAICLKEIYDDTVLLSKLSVKCSLIKNYMIGYPSNVKNIHITIRFFLKKKGILTNRLYRGIKK